MNQGIKHFLVFFFVVSIFAFSSFSHLFKLRADTFIFTGAGLDGEWYNESNWQGGMVPSSSDAVIVQASVFTASLGEPTVASLDVEGSSQLQINITAETANFYDNSILQKMLTGSASFYDSSIIEADGNVTNGVSFYDNSYNNTSTSNLMNATFYDSSENRSAIGGDATFNGSSINYGSVTGTATIGCLATNLGSAGTVVYSDCELYYYTNTSNRNWDDINLWYVDSNHTQQAIRLPTSRDTVFISALVDSYSGGSIEVDTVYVLANGEIDIPLTASTINVSGNGVVRDTITTYTINFYGNSINYGDVNATFQNFYGSSTNSGTLTGSSLSDPTNFSDESTNAGTVNGAAFFNCDATNNGTVSGIVINDTCITNVTSTNSNGSYGLNQLITITVTFSYDVGVTGTPELALSLQGSGDPAQYSSGSGTNTLTFLYTIEAGMFTSDLDYVDVNSLTLSGGSIYRLNDDRGADLTLPQPGSPGSISANKNIYIDTQSPVISDVTADAATTTAVVSWATNELTDAKVYYGLTSGNYTNSTSSVASTTNHSLTLTGLSSFTNYYFVVVSKDSLNNYSTSTESVFRTLGDTNTTQERTITSSGSVAKNTVTANQLSPEVIEIIQDKIELLKDEVAKRQKDTVYTPFPLNLQLHDKGLYVKNLQKFLNTRGFTLAADGYGSLGLETEYFGIKTYKALIQFQESVGLPQTGFFGPKTRSFVNNLFK